MGYEKAVNSYRKTSVETSDKLNLVIMCYEEAIHAIKQAKVEYKQANYPSKAKHLTKAQDIILELLSCLDREKGEAIAANLAGLYSYMLRRLMLGDRQRDLRAFDEVAGLLGELLESWKVIASDGKVKTQLPGTYASPPVLARGVAV